MNKRNRAQASSLFLLELTMAILFFSIASAVCVQIFVKSRAMSLHAEELNAAVREVSSAAEIVRASKSRAEAEEMIRVSTGMRLSGRRWRVKVWQECRKRIVRMCLTGRRRREEVRRSR